MMSSKFFRGLLFVAGAVFCQSMAHASYSCGQTVSGNVTLDTDIHCVLFTGLFVGADNTTINLNGHTISCTGNGYQGSCQVPVGGYSGIMAFNHKNVHILGPGTITGFTTGINTSYANGLYISHVTITGPPEVSYSSPRPASTGIVVFGTTCPVSSVGFASAASIMSNDVSNHTIGIELWNTSCDSVVGNTVHNNNGGYYTFSVPNSSWTVTTGTPDSHGIVLLRTNQSTVSGNFVYENGTNDVPQPGSPFPPDSGILVREAQSAFNNIQNNTVISNCGNGITMFNGAFNNTVQLNTIHFNPMVVPTQCRNVSVDLPAFFDLAEVNQGAGNTYNPNNLCKKQGPGIPAGVCNPLE